MEELVALIRKRVSSAPIEKPSLLLVKARGDEKVVDDPSDPDRKALLREIKYLAKAYRLTWMMNQATFRKGKLKDLDDGELVSLLKDMQRAIECPDDDVSYKEAGLLKHLAV